MAYTIVGLFLLTKVFEGFKKVLEHGTENLEIIKEIEEINNRALKRDRKKVYQEMVDKSVRVEYSKGGEMSTFGIYDIEPFSEKLIINYRKGRKIKDGSKGFSFKYYFDENDNLI